MHLYQPRMDLTLLSQRPPCKSGDLANNAYANTEQKRWMIEKSMSREVTGRVDIPHFTISD